VNGVFYDLQFTLTLAAGQSMPIAFVPSFQATALGIVAPSFSGQIDITTTTGDTYPLPVNGDRIVFPRLGTPAAITLTGPMTIRGLSLVDQRSGAFQSLTLGPFRLVHSGDVKIYENLAVLPRAFVGTRALPIVNDQQARAALADPSFDPASTVILANSQSTTTAAPGLAASRPATITTYLPEQIALTADGPGTLVLTDAYYPGWTASIDGVPAPIERADIMFRGLSLPVGQHQVEFRYSPTSVWLGLAISGLAWAALVAGWLSHQLRRQKRAAA
jgi:hypothetical protein